MTHKAIGTALLSYGMSGEVFHGPLLKAHPHFEVKAVLHRNTTKKVTHEFPVVNSLDAILDDQSIELVVVNSPNDTHFPYTSAAIKAGKHVVVEKPFTVTVPEADQLIALARNHNRILTVFQNRRWDGGFLTLRKILQEHMLGRVVELEMHYDRYRNYIEEGSWKEENTPGTGILYNLGSHMLDQVIVLLGMPQYLDARTGTQRTGGRIMDYYDIRLLYEGMNVIVKSSYLVREPGPMYKVYGTEGAYIKYGIDPQEQALKEKQTPGLPGWGLEPQNFWGKINTTFNGLHVEGAVETLPGNYLAYYDNVFEAIRLNKPLAVKPEQARDVIRLIEATIASSLSKSAIKID
jgi:scyllo-inositol 2-dehydrogenase (NADP+)